MAEENVTVTCNAESVEELKAALDIVSEVFAVTGGTRSGLTCLGPRAVRLMISLLTMTRGL
jgi:hypothetical protein